MFPLSIAHLKVNNWELLCSIPEFPALIWKDLKHSGWHQSLRILNLNLSICASSIHLPIIPSLIPLFLLSSVNEIGEIGETMNLGEHNPRTAQWLGMKKEAGTAWQAVRFPSPHPSLLPL